MQEGLRRSRTRVQGAFVSFKQEASIFGPWALVALLAVFAVAPLTYPGFFEAHSGFVPVYRVAHVGQAVDWGGVADPIRGEGALPYLLIWPLWKVSGSGVAAVKWGYGLAFLLGAWGVAAWARRRLGTRGAILSAVVYTYLPWHLATVYVRGAYAEAWLWAFWPWSLWAADRLGERRRSAVRAGIAVGVPVLAATGWTQPGLALLFLPLLATYYLIVASRQRAWILKLAGAAALLGLASWFLAGRAPEAPLPFAQHFLYPFQLLSAWWGQGISVPGWEDGLPFQLGMAAVGLTLVAVALWVGKRSGRAAEAGAVPADPAEGGTVPMGRAVWLWLAVLLVLIVSTLPLAGPLWRLSRLQGLLTYPWQVLALTGLPLAFLAGSVVRSDEGLAELPMWGALLALVVLASYSYLQPRFTQVDPGSEPVAAFQAVGADAPQILIVQEQIVPPSEITPTVTLILTWQAIEPVAQDYTVFVHLLAGTTKVAQLDSRPCGGECPTDSWQPGEIIVDRYPLALPEEAPAGPYRVAAGLYLLESGKRATVAGRDDETVYFHVP
jgi:hypothetical protein